MSTQQNVLNMRRSERSTAQSVYDKEFGESTEARGVLDAAMKKVEDLLMLLQQGNDLRTLPSFLEMKTWILPKQVQLAEKCVRTQETLPSFLIQESRKVLQETTTVMCSGLTKT